MTLVARHPLVVLAGGRGARMGLPKALLASGEWLAEQLAAFARAGGARVVIVLGHSLAEQFGALPWLTAHLAGFRHREGLAVAVAVNHAPGRGPFSSLQVGLAAARADVCGAFVLPVDAPCAEPGVFAALAGALVGAAEAVTPTHEGRGGHPVLLAASLASRILSARCDERLDHVLRALAPGRRLRVPVTDARVLTDLDTPSEFAAYRGAQTKGIHP